MRDIGDDEALKAACHGILLGCLLPVVAYNLSAKKVFNSLIYLSLVGFELLNIVDHIKERNRVASN